MRVKRGENLIWEWIGARQIDRHVVEASGGEILQGSDRHDFRESLPAQHNRRDLQGCSAYGGSPITYHHVGRGEGRGRVGHPGYLS